MFLFISCTPFLFFFFSFFILDKLHQLSLQFYKMTLTKTSYEIKHPLKILWEGVWTQFIHSIILNNVKPFNIFYWKQILTNPPFGLYYLHILSMIAKFSKRSRMNNHVINQMFKVPTFCNLKLYIKYEFMDEKVNNFLFCREIQYIC